MEKSFPKSFKEMKDQGTDKVAVIFNTNQLGGAERSLIEQLSVAEINKRFHFFVPDLKLPADEIKEILRAKGFTDLVNYNYPLFLYKLSRKDYHKLPLIILSLPLLLLHLLKWHQKFRDFTKFYINGNKAILPILVWSVIFRKKIKIYWHFRDFPSPRAFRLIGKAFRWDFLNNMDIKIIANSLAVEKELKVFFPNLKTECLYNLSGQLPARNVSEKIKHIGVVSMLAPWKGLHTVILMAKLYEKELKEIGIDKISFYGEAIYQTAGEHQNYAEQIQLLTKKLQLNWVCWAGKVPPSKIFNQIDVLIHPSVLPEPFGRVILEAFKTKVPVISTGLGGASELIGDNNEFGETFQSFDYHGLFLCIKALTEDSHLLKTKTTQAFNHSQMLELKVVAQTKALLNSL